MAATTTEGQLNDNTPPAYLTPEELSKRWNCVISVRTMANWRSCGSGSGPRFVKVGGRILYKKSDVEEWEQLRTATATNEYKSA